MDRILLYRQNHLWGDRILLRSSVEVSTQDFLESVVGVEGQTAKVQIAL